MAAVNANGEVALCVGSDLGSVLPSLGCATGPQGDAPSCADGPTFDQGIVIAQYWGSSYFHFMVEGLPRLSLALDHLERVGKLNLSSWHVHVGMQLHPVVRLMGFTLPIVTGNVRVARCILVPPSTPCGGYPYAPSIVRGLRDTLRHALPQPVQDKRVVVVIRRDGGSRSLLNHRELVQHLSSLKLKNTEVVEHTGKETLTEQLTLFAAATAPTVLASVTCWPCNHQQLSSRSCLSPGPTRSTPAT